MFKTACPAKINLFLKVTGKRADGFHDLESLFAFLDLADELEVEKSDTLKIEISGEFANGVDLQKNLFTEILDYFKKNFEISENLRIKVVKNIPVGAGLGGGSSNAAFFMKALNEIFSLKLPNKKLQEISLNFGSDIPFFFENQAAIVKGRGEVIESFPPFGEISALVVNPKIALSTPEVFKKFHSLLSLSKRGYSPKTATLILQKKNVIELLNMPNDLEEAAKSKLPVIPEILESLKNSHALAAKMSGSGATCFGIFDAENLEKAEAELLKKFPQFFVKKVKILSHV